MLITSFYNKYNVKFKLNKCKKKMVIKEVLTEHRQAHISSGKFSISSVGSCWRKKYMEMKGLYKPKFDTKTLRVFAIGDAFHEIGVGEFLTKGDNAGVRVVAAETEIPEQKYISGRSDLIISHSKFKTDLGFNELFVVDIKSSGNWMFNKIGEGDYSEIQNYIYQVQLYLHFFHIKRGFLVFISKEKASVDEVEVIYDQTLCEKLIADIENFMINYVAKDILPPPCSGGHFGCEACGIKGDFNDDKKTEKNGGEIIPGQQV